MRFYSIIFLIKLHGVCNLVRSKISNICRSVHYKKLLEILKTITIQERYNFVVSLIIDLYFIEYDESEIIN